MKFSTLISVDGLAQFMESSNWVVIDCRFWLDDADKGRLDYLESHIPGAYYAHLNEDLSGPIVAGKTGRHPLPDVDVFSRKLGSWGIGSETQVVVYDDRSGMIAARLWWLLHWMGHENVAVLDGGFPVWVASGRPVNNHIPKPKSSKFAPNIQTQMIATADDVLNRFGDPGYMLVDSRAPERYLGIDEPIDPVAGRIPGALNYPFERNFDVCGNFQLKHILKGRFDSLFGGIPTKQVTFYCGSGVTAAVNVLAVFHSGLGMPQLYAGSWSEWITDAERPILKHGP
ncbi:MAG: sulfurtransferase [Anaerolineales bacterium]